MSAPRGCRPFRHAPTAARPFYHLPTPLDKLSLLSQEEDSLALAQRGGDAEQAVDKWVLDHYTGISPLIAREFAFRAGHETDVRFGRAE